MLKSIVWGQTALHNLRNNERGVVSFEYIIVAFCVVTAVGVAFGLDGTTGIGAALTTGINKVIGLLPGAAAT